MKKVKFLIGFLLIFFASHAQDNFKVGKIENGKPVLTVNTDLLSKTLSKNLASQSNINAVFTSVELIKDNTSYLLIFHGDKYKTTFRGTADINLNVVVNPKTSCTTSDKDCTKDPNGCVPTSGQGCACTGCPADAVCTKTCSSASLLE